MGVRDVPSAGVAPGGPGSDPDDGPVEGDSIRDAEVCWGRDHADDRLTLTAPQLPQVREAWNPDLREDVLLSRIAGSSRSFIRRSGARPTAEFARREAPASAPKRSRRSPEPT